MRGCNSDHGFEEKHDYDNIRLDCMSYDLLLPTVFAKRKNEHLIALKSAFNSSQIDFPHWRDRPSYM